jgi:hypothetical protein
MERVERQSGGLQSNNRVSSFVSPNVLFPLRDHIPLHRTAPDFNAFFEDAIDELDPEQQVEKTYWSINEPNFCWRSLRMLGKHRLDLCADFGVGSRDQDGKVSGG